ncbi:hypothetical protein ACP2W0_13410 [Pseudobacillus badius]|uniref:hypothetical protein n=1 Tax=Bacillus badius TaxID=1455 RepID=UPI003CF5941E
MDKTNRDMVESLRQHNERLMENLLSNFRQKRTNAKWKESLKKDQAESLEALKKQFLPTTDSTNSSLNNLLDKLSE